MGEALGVADTDPEADADADGEVDGDAVASDALDVGADADVVGAGEIDDGELEADTDAVADDDSLELADALNADALDRVSLTSGVADGSTDESLDGSMEPTRACSDDAVSEGVGCGVAASDVCDGEGALEVEGLGVSSTLADGVGDAGGTFVDVGLEEIELSGEAFAVGVLDGRLSGSSPSTQSLGIPVGSGVGSSA